ncbi:MAG: 1-acyl-sn-glycerol-3-phosphate acyltransferase [Armatimonadetes bacterium]|nr:1-acyl-sn-glycerol-3-phosphate acyltransferase [Armatimonadota bacterium]
MQNFPREGGFVIVANHPTWLEPPLIATVCPRALRIVAKERLFHLPVVGTFLAGLGCYPVRDDPVTGKPTADMGSLLAMVKVVKNGDVLLIFPEGGRSDFGKLLPFELGASVLAMAAKAPIVPVAVVGAYEAWPMDRILPRPYRIVVQVGEPIHIPKGKHRVDPLTLTEQIRARIAAMLEARP